MEQPKIEELDLKKIALGIGEDLTVRIIKEVVRPMATAYILKSENKVDDILLPFLDQLEDALVQLADKIDGEDNR